MSEKIIAANLRAWRQSLRLKQSTVAEIIGISRPSYVQIEKGSRSLYATEISRLAEVFNFNINKLYTP